MAAAAQARALAECGAGCSVVLTFGRCAAYAADQDADSTAGWAEAYASASAAQEAALAECRSRGGGSGCIVRAWGCNGPVVEEGLNLDRAARRRIRAGFRSNTVVFCVSRTLDQVLFLRPTTSWRGAGGVVCGSGAGLTRDRPAARGGPLSARIRGRRRRSRQHLAAIRVLCELAGHPPGAAGDSGRGCAGTEARSDQRGDAGADAGRDALSGIEARPPVCLRYRALLSVMVSNGASLGNASSAIQGRFLQIASQIQW